MHRQLMWSRVIQLRGPLTSSCKKLQVKVGGVPRSTELREEELGGGWTGLITKLANVCVYQASFRVWMEGALG